MRWLRGVLLADPAVIVATIFFGSVSLLVSFFDETGRAQMRVARAWARTLLAFGGVKVRIEGLEHIDPQAVTFLLQTISAISTLR